MAAQGPGGSQPAAVPSRPAPTQPGAAPARRAGGPTAAPPPATATPSLSPFSAPAEGVYAYATHGYEKISFGGARHDYPSETFATARRRPGCQWEFEHRVAKEHVETRLFCGESGTFFFLQQTIQVTFYGQTNGTTVRCDPPEITAHVGDAPSSQRQFVCHLDNGDQAAETVTYLGPATVPIDGADVAALHVLVEGRMSGKVNGTSRIELWLHPQTGLTLRSVANVQSSAPAFGTRVDYEEDASYLLEHLAPAT